MAKTGVEVYTYLATAPQIHLGNLGKQTSHWLAGTGPSGTAHTGCRPASQRSLRCSLCIALHSHVPAVVVQLWLRTIWQLPTWCMPSFDAVCVPACDTARGCSLSLPRWVGQHRRRGQSEWDTPPAVGLLGEHWTGSACCHCRSCRSTVVGRNNPAAAAQSRLSWRSWHVGRVLSGSQEEVLPCSRSCHGSRVALLLLLLHQNPTFHMVSFFLVMLGAYQPGRGHKAGGTSGGQPSTRENAVVCGTQRVAERAPSYSPAFYL